MRNDLEKMAELSIPRYKLLHLLDIVMYYKREQLRDDDMRDFELTCDIETDIITQL